MYNEIVDRSGPGLPCNGKGVFVPELLDIICPTIAYNPLSCPSSGGQQVSLDTMNSSELFEVNFNHVDMNENKN